MMMTTRDELADDVQEPHVEEREQRGRGQAQRLHQQRLHEHALVPRGQPWIERGMGVLEQPEATFKQVASILQ